MKILVIQLARLGDIYSTWPSLNALKRKFPNSQLDVMARKRFSNALLGMDAVDKIINLPTESIFAPILDKGEKWHRAFAESYDVLNNFINKHSDYDLIINLSFSPASSFLTYLLSNENTNVRGYTRFNDGFLSIPDDASAYFYAQVGVRKSNRFHLVDLFSEVCEVALEEDDWKINSSLVEKELNYPLEENYVVLHIGASEDHKVLNKEKWASILNQSRALTDKQIVMIGADNEADTANDINLLIRNKNILNIVGQTEIEDLFSIIGNAESFISCDSGPMHIASLCSTPCFNISSDTVRFWETGPKAKNSRIYQIKDFNTVGSDEIAHHLDGFINASVADEKVVLVNSNVSEYECLHEREDDFQWKLIRAIYLGADFPVPNNSNFIDALVQLSELNHIALQQLYAMDSKLDYSEHVNLLDRVDELMDTVTGVVKSTQPLVAWLKTEKVRTAPGETKDIVNSYLNLHNLFQDVLTIYLGDEAKYINSNETNLGGLDGHK